jgi:hypothetical protein
MRIVVVLVLLSSGIGVAAPRWLDTPAWPTGSVLHLTWLVGEDPKPRDGELPRQPIELLATIGKTTRSITLPAQQGGLHAINQSACRGSAYPLERSEVAKITFYEGGAGGFFVRRAAKNALEVIEWNQTDGACESASGELVACPRSERVRAQFHVPAGVKIDESIELVDAKGNRTVFDCE